MTSLPTSQKIADQLCFETIPLKEEFIKSFEKFSKEFGKKAQAGDPLLPGDFVSKIKELSSLCLYPSEFPVSGYFNPNYDVYLIIGLALLEAAFNDTESKMDFVNKAWQQKLLNNIYYNLLKSLLSKESGNYKDYFLCAKRAYDTFSTNGTAYRVLHESWEKCNQEEIETYATYHKDAMLHRKFCGYPFRELFIGFNGKEFVMTPCHSNFWLSYGKRIKMDGLVDAMDENPWRSAELNEVRASILDGSFKYCAKVRCPALTDPQMCDKSETPELSAALPDWEVGPETITLCFDYLCNLKCRSCRTKKKRPGPMHSEAAFEKVAKALTYFLTPRLKWLLTSANGEALASPYTLNLLRNLPYEQAPNLKIGLSTNGELLPTRWHRLEAAASRVKKLIVSIHAITEETYSLLRPGGSLKRYLKGLEVASQLRQSNQLEKLMATVTIHADNMVEAPEMFRICQELGFDSCLISKLENWGTFSAAEFKRLSIWNQDDPLHGKWLEICKELRQMESAGKTKLGFSNLLK